MSENAPSSRACDVIVIGAGLTGLTAAAYLTHAGARVLVCEQAPQVGGLFSSFWRQGYLFDGSIKAIENSGLMLSVLGKLGLLEEVDLVPSPVAIVADGLLRPVRAWDDVEAYFGWLIACWPAEEVGLDDVSMLLRPGGTIVAQEGG